MTISSELNRVSYSGNGATVEFDVPFRFIAQEDLSVLVVVDATGVATSKVIDTDYTVAGEGDEGGGTVTFLTAEEMGETDAVLPPQTGETIVIFSDPPLTQLVDLIAGGPLPAESLEEALDRAVLQQKRSRELAARSLRLPDSDPEDVDTEIPAKVDRAGMVLGFDDDGDLVLFSAEDPAFSTFTPNRALVTNGGGSPAASDVTSAEIDHLDGVTSPIQTQFNALPATISGTVRSYTKQQNFGEATLTDGANIAWNLDDAQTAKVTLAGNRTLSNPTNMVAGGTYILRVIQDGMGSRTLAYDTAYDWGEDGAPVLSTTADKVDVLTFYCDGTSMLGAIKKGFG